MSELIQTLHISETGPNSPLYISYKKWLKWSEYWINLDFSGFTASWISINVLFLYLTLIKISLVPFSSLFLILMILNKFGFSSLSRWISLNSAVISYYLEEHLQRIKSLILNVTSCGTLSSKLPENLIFIFLILYNKSTMSILSLQTFYILLVIFFPFLASTLIISSN